MAQKVPKCSPNEINKFLHSLHKLRDLSDLNSLHSENECYLRRDFTHSEHGVCASYKDGIADKFIKMLRIGDTFGKFS